MGAKFAHASGLGPPGLGPPDQSEIDRLRVLGVQPDQIPDDCRRAHELQNALIQRLIDIGNAIDRSSTSDLSPAQKEAFAQQKHALLNSEKRRRDTIERLKRESPTGKLSPLQMLRLGVYPEDES